MVDAVDAQQIESAEIENGHLFVKGVNSMAKVDLGQVVGAKGDKGDAGTAATITIGTVTTGAAGSSASVTNAGTATAARLNFTIPRGNTGETGAAGATGATGATGPKGDDGITPTFSIENGHLFADYDNPYTGS